MTNKTNQNKSQKKTVANPLEAIKDLSQTTANQMGYEARQKSQDIARHIFGLPPRSISGEIEPGQSLEFKEVLSGQQEAITYQRKRIAFERKLLKEEERRVEKKSNELKVQLKVLQDEIVILAKKTEGLAEETQIAAMQAPVKPGVYHVIFFEKLFEFIKSFNKKINEARIWLQATNKRASKRNRWGQMYKKHGAKYLLSGEHYIARSAG